MSRPRGTRTSSTAPTASTTSSTTTSNTTTSNALAASPAHDPDGTAAPSADPTPFDVYAAPLHGTQLIEASAGTGKTWTLTALHLRLLLESNLPIGSILVVTFTEAAVAELQTRVRQRLLQARDVLQGRGERADAAVARIVKQARERSGTNHDTLSKRVDQALAEFDDAPISTIHAFCQRVLRESAFAAHLPLESQTLTDDDDLRLAAVRDFWRREIATPDLPPHIAQRLAQTGATPERWEPMLRDALKFPLARPVWGDASDAIDAIDAIHAIDAVDAANAIATPAAPDHEALLEARRRCFEHAAASWQREHRLALRALLDAVTKPSYTEDRIAKAQQRWQHLFDAARPAAPLAPELMKLFTTGWLAQQQQRSKKSKLASVPALALFDDLQALFDAHAAIDDGLRADIARLKRRMLDHAARHLHEAKAAQGVVTFQDMLTRTHERLHADAALAATVRQRFPAALVDEFQDTDPVQLGIFERLYGLPGQASSDTASGNTRRTCMVLVGDPKQAIYAFRGADLDTYLRARDHARAPADVTRNINADIAHDQPVDPGRHQRVWSLDTNQRASPELLHALNALFTRHRHVFGRQGLEFRAAAQGEAPRKPFIDEREPPGAAALRIWTLPGDLATTAAAQHAATRACAAEIARTLDTANAGRLHYDGRALRGGDIAVLVRTHIEGRLMRRALADVGVASVDLSRASVFASLDAAELEVMLHAILDPGHTGKLRAAMATSLLGVDAERLAALHERSDDDPTAQHGADAVRDAEAMLDTTVARLLSWRTTWQRHGVAAMLAQLLDDVGAGVRLLAADDGERRMTNLLHLMELLAHQQRLAPLPQALLHWLAQQRERADSRDDTQLRLESDRQLVQIVTVHRAKGLQYPIVVLPLLWHEPARRPAGGAPRYHDERGAQVLDFRDRDHLDDELKSRLRDDALAESLRLLYVALTRAEHRCILVVDAHARSGPPPGRSQGGPAPGSTEWPLHGQGGSERSERGGTVIGGYRKASLRSMLNWIVAGQGPGFAHWVDTKKGDTKKVEPARSRLIEQAWCALADATPHVVLAPLPDVDAGLTTTRRGSDDAPPVQRFPAPGPIGASWRLGSFTSFLRGDAVLPAADLLDTLDPASSRGVDRDAGMSDDGMSDAGMRADGVQVDEAASIDDTAPRVDSSADGADAGAALHTSAAAVFALAPAPIADDDVLRFPRGPAAGDAIHAALERANFTQPHTWPAACAAALRLHPQRACPQAQAMLEGMLRNLTATEIAPQLALSQIGAAQRLDELEFDLPLPALRLDRLEAKLHDLGLPVPPLGTGDSSHAFHGHLRGFVDTVFEHQGRYWLADWKSNHLGDTAAHYAQAPLEHTIARHGYHLQHVLYAIALLRHLRRCLGDAQAHAAWGGAFVLFVRGIRPGWVDAQGRPTGVFHRRLEPAVLDELARCFG